MPTGTLPRSWEVPGGRCSVVVFKMQVSRAAYRCHQDFKTLSFETPPALYPKPLNPNAFFARRMQFQSAPRPGGGLGFGWLRFAFPRRICPRFWALERPAAACVFRGLQNAHQGSSGFGPLRGLQQHAFSGACKTHIREALPKPGNENVRVRFQPANKRTNPRPLLQFL